MLNTLYPFYMIFTSTFQLTVLSHIQVALVLGAFGFQLLHLAEGIAVLLLTCNNILSVCSEM
jgi:hypothetical protein